MPCSMIDGVMIEGVYAVSHGNTVKMSMPKEENPKQQVENAIVIAIIVTTRI